ncbi:MAG: hypothetical protein JW863_00435 [Chitinispirillaceae bacterium]|nr:hypothetical protein [Chitinispirillaceae bacterium]
MPLRNGTGPMGSGPGSGRGRGWCRTGTGNRNIVRQISGGRHRWLPEVAVSLVALMVHDALNPAGLLRRSMRMLLSVNKGDVVQPGRREAEYSVSDTRQVPERRNNSVQ